MMKSEFVSKVNELGGQITFESLSSDDYEIIEHVYMFHPSIPEVNGKEAIARIWMLPGGMRIIRDMLETANAAEKIENEMLSARREMAAIQKKLDCLKKQLENL